MHKTPSSDQNVKAENPTLWGGACRTAYLATNIQQSTTFYMYPDFE